MKFFNFLFKKSETFISDRNHKKIIFLFSFSYYLLMLLILYYCFSTNLGVFTYDSGVFHSSAVQYANALNDGGLTSLPSIVRYAEYQFPSIFGGVVYYLFGIHHPFLIIFFNILFKSISVYFLYSLFFKITEQKFISFLAVSPFLFFPTEFGNVALINKGVFFSLGIILVFSSFVSTRKNLIIKLFFAFLIFSSVRPQYLEWLHNIAIVKITDVDTMTKKVVTKIPDKAYVRKKLENLCTKFNGLENTLVKIKNLNAETENLGIAYICKKFENLCKRFDGLAKALVKVRNDPSVKQSKSNFDYSTLPSNGKEFLLYIPKGFLIGLFKPYPTEWFVLENRTNKLFYLAASFEAIVLYLGIMLLIFSLYKWRMKKTLFYITLLCLSGILIYGTVSYNLGCLYRHRGIFINIICGIGLMYSPILFSIGRTYLFVLRRFFLRINTNLTSPSNSIEGAFRK